MVKKTGNAPASDESNPEPMQAASATAPVPPASGPQRTGSVLDSLRHNHVGGLFAGLIVAIAVGLLLSVLVPNEPHALALVLLGLLLSAAVGFTVRYVSLHRGLLTQAAAFVSTVIGVQLMTVTGMVGGELPGLPGIMGAEVSFNDALVLALATPAIAVGPVLAGLIAVIIVGWGGVPVDPHARHQDASTYSV
jgi:hypothetical protein